MADDVEKQMSEDAAMVEVGSPGLDQTGGWIDEDFLPKWTGRQKYNVIEEMRKNDPVVGASLLAIKNIVRSTEWFVEPGGDSNRAKRAAEFVDSTREDMAKSWEDFIGEAMSMVPYGWSLFEMVFKRRNGNPFAGAEGSKFDDNRIGLKRLSLRAQDSLDKWQFSEKERPTHMVQQKLRVGHDVEPIPLDKCLHFRTSTYKDNPEGLSALRTAFRPWSFKKRIEEIEGIGIERDLAGIPVVKAPPRLFRDDASDADKSTLNDVQQIAKNLHNDKESGIVLPALYDSDGNELYSVELMSSGGRQRFDTGSIIQRKNQMVAVTLLSDFILIGHESTGSFALASSKTNMFARATGAFMDIIAEEFNRKAVPLLMELNGMTDVPMPKLKHRDIETLDLDSLARYIRAMSTANIDLTGEDIQEQLFDQADLTMPEEPGRDDGGSPASSDAGDTAIDTDGPEGDD